MKLTIDGYDLEDLLEPMMKLLTRITAENENLKAVILLVDTEKGEFVQFLNSHSSAVQMMCEGIINNTKDGFMNDNACLQMDKLRLLLNKRKLN
jgi:hypothetical protein